MSYVMTTARHHMHYCAALTAAFATQKRFDVEFGIYNYSDVSTESQ
jgi:hypothetical protein